MAPALDITLVGQEMAACAALSASHRSTRFTPVRVSLLRLSKIRSWGTAGVFSVVFVMAQFSF